MNNYPDVAREFIKLLAKDVKDKEEQLMQMAYHSVRKKMADVMVRLQSRQNDIEGSFNISRENLAAMTGMTTVTVSRTLSDFKTKD